MVLNEQKCRFNPAKMVIDPAKRGISPTKTDQCFTNKWWLNNPKKIRLRWHTYFWSLHRHFLWGLPSQNSYNQTWLADFETINLIYHISYIADVETINLRWVWGFPIAMFDYQRVPQKICNLVPVMVCLLVLGGVTRDKSRILGFVPYSPFSAVMALNS